MALLVSLTPEKAADSHFSNVPKLSRRPSEMSHVSAIRQEPLCRRPASEAPYDTHGENCIDDGCLARNWQGYRSEAGGKRRKSRSSSLSERRPGQSYAGETARLRLGWLHRSGGRLQAGRNPPHVRARQIGIRRSRHFHQQCEAGSSHILRWADDYL